MASITKIVIEGCGSIKPLEWPVILIRQLYFLMLHVLARNVHSSSYTSTTGNKNWHVSH